ncbi:50S ribosomal protein L22 [Candidatus Purcelliella pentastirinorum]|uniref:Large ribosomal subunit protein uL22 n=1 Tax=Candidatus Purcelliella pentastirinorum TaxID=472834 RepID=A0A346DZM5_9ENTR|nr:50S ribosomal protein L22 [Candidatus Purcelliella pentastirinorum]AXN02180.1 LSU ribosomal protein L22p (L17e) [Candidatus Purcelliella pentastirinorum]WDI79130.1 50S ribosomal protein L22 [Candidatus Purcelliella pentastirinorum]WDR80269.1 50S ribosomal protein L22 [Candidatus Purcelliella pentastirinorum]
MEAIAKHRYVKISAQKARLVIDLIRGKKVIKALDILFFTNNKASRIIKKILISACSNARVINSIDISKLFIYRSFVDEGSRIKRTMPRARGRADKILKRTSHITIIVSDY